MQILIVDDTKEIREILTEILIGEGHNVIEAIDGSDGLWKLAQDGPFDLIITDLQMPKMDGYQFASEARKMISSNIPILLHTANPSAKITRDIQAVVLKGEIDELLGYLDDWPLNRSCDI